jgi:hypothetical protein
MNAEKETKLISKIKKRTWMDRKRPSHSLYRDIKILALLVIDEKIKYHESF